ncbi:hypothetical protein BH09BAC6_BH09BAC6_01190 [soil metagenome]
MKNVLLVTDVNFWEGSSGNRARILALVEYLAQHVQLTVVNTGPAFKGIEQQLQAQFEADFYLLEHVKYLSSTGYGRRLKAFLKGKHFDTVIIEYIHSSYFLNFLLEDTKIILDAHDIISDRADEFRKFNYGGALYEMPRDTEVEILNVYDHVIAICEPDREKISAIIGDDKTLLCPHPVAPILRPLRKDVKNIAFVASAYLPNQDAINFFAAHCWPQLYAKYQMRLSVYGTVGQGLNFSGEPGIVIKGFVPDINQIYAEADIIINPVRFGAGLKIKNVEALANGLPLVTTAHGARGLEALIDKGFLLADEPCVFIRAISSLIESIELRKQLGECAYSFIKENFSPDSCFAPLLSAINRD